MSHATSTQSLIDRFQVQIDPHLDREVTVPVSAGLQRQGDVIVIPAKGTVKFKLINKVPATGVAVVRGESGGNTHLLLADGDVFYVASTSATTAENLTLGTLVVADGATAYLAHPEHGYAGIAPGTYRVGRQREQAEVARVVAD